MCLIGASLAQQLFPTVDAVGRILRVGRDPIRVIGTFEEIGSILGRDQDNYLVTPLSTFLRMRGSRHSLTLEVKAAGDGLLFEQAQDQARALMRARRGIKGAQKENFYLGTSASYIELWETISSSFFVVFISISSIAAVVGGIVIMNIMLVSVTERTKEIGVRRACGARRGDILRQFLTESMMQCIVGGSFGVLVGFAVALLLRRFASFPADVQWWVAVLGVGVASAVACFLGSTRRRRLPIWTRLKHCELNRIKVKMTSSQLRENVRVAFHSIQAQKVRSSLTLLGVVIGVSSVIGVAAIIEGLNRGVIGRVQTLGSKVFILSRLPAGTFGRPREDIRLRKHFRFSDARRIEESSPSAEYVSAFAYRAAFFGDLNEVRYRNEQVTNVIVRGVDHNHSAAIPMFDVSEGRTISRYDQDHARAVAVIGQGIAVALFPQVDPIGKTIRLNGLPFDVVGVFFKG